MLLSLDIVYTWLDKLTYAIWETLNGGRYPIPTGRHSLAQKNLMKAGHQRRQSNTFCRARLSIESPLAAWHT